MTPRVRIKPTRVPGEGYDSEAPDLEDDPLIEEGVVIRFLNDSNLEFVQAAVESGDLTGVNIKWITKDKAVVSINGALYSARLIDLPTVNEIYKTIDKKNIFKLFDVCQILLVLHTINPTNFDKTTDFEVPQEYLFNHPFYNHVKNNEIKKRKMVYRDGLLNPFKDVYRRFRPTRADHRVIQDLETKVDELIKLDNLAEESHFELIDKREQRYSGTPSSVSTPTRPQIEEEEHEDEEEERELDENMVEDIELHLEEELNKMEDSDGEHVVSVPQINDMLDKNVVVEEADDDEDDEDDDDDDDDEEEDEEDKSEKQHVKLLEEEILELEKAVEHHKKNLATASSKMLKMKFQNTYSSLKASLDQKKRDLAKIMDEQEQNQKEKEQSEEQTESNVERRSEEEEEDEDEDEGVNDDIDDIDDLF